MSDLLSEPTVEVPPLSMVNIEVLAAGVREVLGLTTPASNKELGRIVESVLPELGILVYPAQRAELGSGIEAVTDPSGNAEIIILLREDLYEDLWQPGRRGNRARATLAHELAHAIVHVPFLRRFRRAVSGRDLLPRITRGAVPAYKCAEWQAFAFAGSFLLPRQSIMSMAASSLEAVADAHGVSVSFLRSHLRRLKIKIGGQ